jgi:hypothetical protein
VVRKATEGGAHWRRERQRRHDGNAASLGLLRCRWLDEEAGDCEGARPCSRRKGNGGGREKGGAGGGSACFKGGRWHGAEEGGWPKVAPHGEEEGGGRA